MKKVHCPHCGQEMKAEACLNLTMVTCANRQCKMVGATTTVESLASDDKFIVRWKAQRNFNLHTGGRL